jgi:hypothetical protein
MLSYSALALTLPEVVPPPPPLLVPPPLSPHPAARVRSRTAPANNANTFCFMIFFPPCVLIFGSVDPKGNGLFFPFIPAV